MNIIIKYMHVKDYEYTMNKRIVGFHKKKYEKSHSRRIYSSTSRISVDKISETTPHRSQIKLN